MKEDRKIWIALVLMVVAFSITAAGFGWVLVRFWSDVGMWARRDLKSQAELAAESLHEPLRTQDFRKLMEFHQSLAARELLLRVRSAQGGWIFHGGYKGATVEEYVPCGDYQVGVAVKESRVYAPFYDALVGFATAVLVGAVGMFIIFFALYRQRIRIKELAKLERFRRDFIADVSHELKTPLTGILGAVELLDDSEGECGQRKFLLSLIKKEVERLNQLVQSILDLARLEKTGETLDITEFDLAVQLKELAEKYGVSYRGMDAESCVVYADASRINQAIANLIENAQKYSGSDDIVLSLSRIDGQVHIAVEDHGVGIPPEHASRIFERFYRVDAARSAEFGGAGLGLAIVRRIAHLHGGEATFTSAQPKGCRFELTLPM